jgi:hypothetical protein
MQEASDSFQIFLLGIFVIFLAWAHALWITMGPAYYLPDPVWPLLLGTGVSTIIADRPTANSTFFLFYKN